MKIGWGDISKDIGLSIRTLQGYVTDYQMPVMRTPTGKPMFSKELFDLWVKKGMGGEDIEKPRPE